jgi:hypothetical protein
MDATAGSDRIDDSHQIREEVIHEVAYTSEDRTAVRRYSVREIFDESLVLLGYELHLKEFVTNKKNQASLLACSGLSSLR